MPDEVVTLVIGADKRDSFDLDPEGIDMLTRFGPSMALTVVDVDQNVVLELALSVCGCSSCSLPI